MGTFRGLCLCRPLSRVRLFATPRAVVRQAPLSVGSSRQEYQRGLPCPPPGDLPDAGTEHASLTSPALVGGVSTTSASVASYAQAIAGNSGAVGSDPGLPLNVLCSPRADTESLTS